LVYRPRVDPKMAFVLMPIRPPFNDYYEDIIEPAAKAAGMEVRKADENYGTGPIIHDIWDHIWKSSVVIAEGVSLENRQVFRVIRGKEVNAPRHPHRCKIPD